MGARPAHFDGDALGFVDVAAEEMSGLAAHDEVADGGGSGVQAGLDQIERGAVRGGGLGDLPFGVFARGMERRRAGVAEAGDLPGADGEVALVEIVQAILIAETGDLGGGFVIPGEYPDLVAARL